MTDFLMNLSYFGMSFLDPYLMFLTAVGVFSGIYVGAIPGLSVTMAVSILISFTFNWGVNEALALIAGIYYGGVYGGSRSAILINVPGAPAAIASALDGYPLAKMGEAGQAIGLTTIMGVFGGLIGAGPGSLAADHVADLLVAAYEGAVTRGHVLAVFGADADIDSAMHQLTMSGAAIVEL